MTPFRKAFHDMAPILCCQCQLACKCWQCREDLGHDKSGE